jgi:hypothetical protein
MIKSISLANFFTAISIPASNIRKDHAENNPAKPPRHIPVVLHQEEEADSTLK